MEATSRCVLKLLMLICGVLVVMATTSDNDHMVIPADCADNKVCCFDLSLGSRQPGYFWLTGHFM